MAKMIPPRMLQTNSPGESDIFVRLRDDAITADWTALHSLDIAVHLRQVSGEVDFLVIVPGKGVLVVEVKACSSIRRDQGIWYLGNAAGESRGPFRQASEAMHSIRGRLVRERPHLSRVPFCSCVIFPRIRFAERSVEWQEWQVIDAIRLRSGPIGRHLLNILNKARDHLDSTPGASWFHVSSKEPYLEQCEEIAEFFRRDFQYFVSSNVISATIAAEVKSFTHEQFVALDAMDANHRVVFRGPAGTGKSVLAIEAARRASHGARRVLLICYNKLLGQKIARDCQLIAPGVNAKTIHSHMMNVAGLGGAAIGWNSEFWESELPQKATDALLRSNSNEFTYDEIIIDEAQDLMREAYLDFLDISLLGGLSAGRWRIFGDFEKQAIYGEGVHGLKIWNARLAAEPTEYSLRINCRNTPGVATVAQWLGGLKPGYTRVLRPHDGIEPTFQFYQSSLEQTAGLIRCLEELVALGLTSDDIVVLSTRADDVSVAASIKTQPWCQRLRPYADSKTGYIRYCSIHAFKGLEAAAIVVTDLDDSNRANFESLIYIAATRSSHRLILVLHESLRPVLLPK